MKLPKLLGINRTLAFVILLERWLGIRFVLQGDGVPGNSFPWYVPIIVLSVDDILWLLPVCADCGARLDILALNDLLEVMLRNS